MTEHSPGVVYGSLNDLTLNLLEGVRGRVFVLLDPLAKIALKQVPNNMLSKQWPTT